MKVLVVDDESTVRRFLRNSLQPHGYKISEAATGEDAILQAATARPDIILLDLRLPDMDGLEVARAIREWTRTPIIVLSVRDQEHVKVAALDAGVDDYLTKPFGLSELLARLRACLRRSQKEDGCVVTNGPLQINLASRQVTLASKYVTLTPTEYDILKVLVRQRGRVITHQFLMREVWGNAMDDLHRLRVNISNLRRKIEPDPSRPQALVTEAGIGYRFLTTPE